jgi:hypothetical protein
MPELYAAGGARVVDFGEAARRLRPGQSQSAPLAVTGKAAPRKGKGRPKTESDYIDEILRFRCALANLAENESDPATLIRYMDPLFGDAQMIREHLYRAVTWINRFAEEWNREQGTHGNPGQIQQCPE